MIKCVKCGNEILTGDIHWEMGLCNNCYNELYKDHKTHISLDKMWLELAISFRDENDKLQSKITDLEAKLAESNENFHHAKEEWENLLHKTCVENLELIEKLGHKLAEKDKKIKSLTLARFGSETNKPILTTTEIINQDKIELLKEVRSNCGFFPAITQQDLDIFNKKQREHFNKRMMEFYDHNVEYIDTIIKKIKGE